MLDKKSILHAVVTWWLKGQRFLLILCFRLRRMTGEDEGGGVIGLHIPHFNLSKGGGGLKGSVCCSNTKYTIQTNVQDF